VLDQGLHFLRVSVAQLPCLSTQSKRSSICWWPRGGLDPLQACEGSTLQMSYRETDGYAAPRLTPESRRWPLSNLLFFQGAKIFPFPHFGSLVMLFEFLADLAAFSKTKGQGVSAPWPLGNP
jgi:hypothetical protein